MATVVSKRYDAATAKVDPEKPYTVEEAIAALKSMPAAKFDESVDLSFRLGVDPKHADQMVRGAVVLPHGIGKSVRVAVFAKGDKEREARDAGADVVGAEDLVERVQGGFMEFDTTIATPDLHNCSPLNNAANSNLQHVVLDGKGNVVIVAAAGSNTGPSRSPSPASGRPSIQCARRLIAGPSSSPARRSCRARPARAA